MTSQQDKSGESKKTEKDRRVKLGVLKVEQREGETRQEAAVRIARQFLGERVKGAQPKAGDNCGTGGGEPTR